MEIKNGALLGQGQFDWIAGANSAVEHKVLCESGNWKDLAIPHEIQVVLPPGATHAYDTSMCVSFNGTTDALEYILMQMLRLNLIPQTTVKWLQEKGYFVNGVINFNERFTGVKGQTTAQGAYQFMVANGAKNFGLIPQSKLPFAKTFNENIDPALIPKELDELGKEFLTHLAINYEWVQPEDTQEFLKYSPLSCVGQYADGDGILNPTGNTGHSMLLINETEEYREIDDSYWRQFKKYKKDKLQSFMAFYITPLKTNTMNTLQWVKDNDKKWVQVTSGEHNGQFGRVLREKLMMFVSSDRGALALLDDKMRTEPSTKITAAEFDDLKRVGMTANF